MKESTIRKPNDQLRSIREEQKWTQQDLADKIAVTRVTVARWESGNTFPNAYFRRKLCLLFGKSERELGLIKEPSPVEMHAVSPQQDGSSQATLLSLEQQNRRRFLAKLHYRYGDILEHSLQGAAQIALEFHSKPDVVLNTTRFRFHQTNLPECLVPAGTSILQMYDQANGELLVLGAPGSGKTTLLLNLAEALYQRALENQYAPFPTIVNLSTWVTLHKPLQEWLVDEIASSYDVPRTPIALWLQEDQILPLLDGLDEIPEYARFACIEAINAFHEQHLVSLVVCSRDQEYLVQQQRLILHNAVIIQPLEVQQIDDYFKVIGKTLGGIRSLIQSNAHLRELVITPLMLHLFMLTYWGVSVQDLQKKGTLEEQQRQIFDQYIQRRLQQQIDNPSFPVEQTKYWLSWLAQRMRQRNQWVFYLEQLQPDWLENRQQYWIYMLLGIYFPETLLSIVLGIVVNLVRHEFRVTDSLVYGLIYGLISEIVIFGKRNISVPSLQKNVGTWKSIWYQLTNAKHLTMGVFISLLGLSYGLSYGLNHGLSFALSFAVICIFQIVLPIEKSRTIQPAETIVWSWETLWQSLTKAKTLKSTLLVVALEGMSYWVIYGPMAGLMNALTIGLCYWLFFGLITGVSSNTLNEQLRVKPNQGIRRSAHNGLWAGLSIGLASGLISFLTSIFTLGLSLRQLVLGLTAVLAIGLIVWFLNGGQACLRHGILRCLLWHTGSIPWNYIHFLDYTTKRILLKREGGGYSFIHRLLLEHFAELSATFPGKQSDQ